jgi:hypothetical protein
MDVFLDVVSDERDPAEYPKPNDYVIETNRELYNVTNVTLISAQLPLSQTHICDTNNTFSISGTQVVLPNRNFADGDELALYLTSELGTQTSNVDRVAFHSNTNTLDFSNSLVGSTYELEFYSGVNGYANLNASNGTPASVMGFNNSNVIGTSDPTANLHSNVIDLHGPTSIVLMLTAGAEDLSRSVYSQGPSSDTATIGNLDSTESHYFGRLITGRGLENEFLTFKDDYPVECYFHKGPESSISRFRIQFFYTIGTKLVPYDFGMRNHTLKFKITCSLDKFKTLKNQKIYNKVLPPPVKLPSIRRPQRMDKNKLLLVLFICLLGGLFLLILKR